LATIHANCKDPTQVGDNLPYSTSCLAETTDSGATWRVLKGPTSGWSEAATVYIFGPTAFANTTAQNGVYFTSNAGGSWTKLSVGGASTSIYRTPDGHSYLGSDYGINYVSPNGSDWTTIKGSPNGFPVIGDGERLFTGYRFMDGSTTQPFFTAPASDHTKWTKLPSPNMSGQGPVEMRYDPQHHLLYAAAQASGLWRMVTR
jgi:hypothetical protein